MHTHQSRQPSRVMLRLDRNSLSAKTQQSRQPKGMVGTVTTELSTLYSIASSFISRIESARAPTRGIGQRQLAGLEI